MFLLPKSLFEGLDSKTVVAKLPLRQIYKIVMIRRHFGLPGDDLLLIKYV